MEEREIYANAHSILVKENEVNSRLIDNNSEKLNDSLIYAIRINDTAMIYDSVDGINEEKIDSLFDSLYKNLSLIYNYQGINIKYFSNWIDDNQNPIYNNENDYLNVMLSNVKALNEIKRILAAYLKIKDNSNELASSKVKTR